MLLRPGSADVNGAQPFQAKAMKYILFTRLSVRCSTGVQTGRGSCPRFSHQFDSNNSLHQSAVFGEFNLSGIYSHRIQEYVYYFTAVGYN